MYGMYSNLAKGMTSLGLMLGLIVAATADETEVDVAVRSGGVTAADASASGQVARRSDPLRASIEELVERDVKRFYLGCSAAALRGTLDSAGTAACSIIYDVLLTRHFNGDFRALLAWSRSQRHESSDG